MLSTSTPRATSSCPDSSTATPTSTRVWPAIAIKGCNPTNFLENLEQQWWKIDDNLTLAGTKASAYATILDSIRDGVTTIFDHHASFCEIPGSLFTIKDAAQELGMRSCLCYEVSDRRGQEKCDQAIAENAEFAQWAAKECRDNDNHMIAAMPNVGWCEAMTMLFENNVKMASKYFDRKLGVLEPGACASATPYLHPPRGLAGRYREELIMSDIMRPIPFSQLMSWIIEEHKTQDAIFGVRKMVTTNQGGALPIFDECIETPFGPAAGPNTQLAQNIVASYVAGSRFFELKTVQVMDGEELSKCVNKPCIVAQDECYNCEWSTELEVPQAFAEYVKAWFACHLIAREYGLGSPDGFVFNMSVGYDLEGIKSPKVDAYIEGMKDASGSDVWNECRTWALANLDKFEHVDAAFVESIPARVSNSITESTLHGCPPAEIERIATYLITEKGLNSYIKCNPTLLGYEFARQRLNELGFDYIVFDDTHFREDLQWADAVPMFERLIALCAERGLEFGVKLTNTFPVDVTRNELPSTEMYMSGRSLFSLTIEAVRRITEQFDGKLRISYSGGATVYNIRALYDAGIWPVTLATDVLKPGGYERFSQMAGEFTDLDGKPFAGVSLDVVTAIQTDSLTNPLYKKPLRPLPDREVAGKSPLSDCFTTPCRTSCPIQQDIPAYLAAVDEGRYEDALNIIIERNALPFITGTICPHPCGRSCERAFYEPEGAQIRASKLKAAREAMTAVLPKQRAQAIANDGERNVAVIGGGPAGLATAFFLTRAGVPVTIFEARDSLGGVVRHVIPEFRIASDDIYHDAELCLAFGAKVQLNARVDSCRHLHRRRGRLGCRRLPPRSGHRGRGYRRCRRGCPCHRRCGL